MTNFFVSMCLLNAAVTCSVVNTLSMFAGLVMALMVRVATAYRGEAVKLDVTP